MYGIHRAKVRTKGNGVDRLVGLHLLHRQKVNDFFLRLLLASDVGTCSFADLLTSGSHKCSTFHEAALKHGLVEPNDWIDQCLDEAVTVKMPHALRRLFATILIFLEPSNPAQMWDSYYVHLLEYYVVRHPCQPQRILSLTFQLISSFLENMGKSLKVYVLQHLCRSEYTLVQRTGNVIDALDAPILEACNAARKQLNNEQRTAYKCIFSHVKEKKLGFFFIDGLGGLARPFYTVHYMQRYVY